MSSETSPSRLKTSACFPVWLQATFPSISVPNSVPLNVLLGPSARACLEEQSRRACNAVANLCALQLYKGWVWEGCVRAASRNMQACVFVLAAVAAVAKCGCAMLGLPTRRKTAACKLYRALVSQLAGGSSSQGPRPATGPLPWLFYSGNSYAHAHVNLT